MRGVLMLVLYAAISRANGVPPSISSPPSNQLVVEGATVELICSVSSTVVAPVEWRFTRGDTTTVVTADNSTLIHTASLSGPILRSNLTLVNVQPLAAGVYACSHTTSQGNATASATVEVFAASSMLLVPTPNVQVTAGTGVTAACVARGQPLPTFSWFRDGVALPSGGPYNITTHQLNSITVMSVLDLCGINSSLPGEYRCSAQNSNYQSQPSNPVSSGFNISLLLPANITSPPLNQSVTEGTRVELTCTVLGTPLPEVEWRFVDGEGNEVVLFEDNSTMITTTSNQNTTTSRLTLLSVHISSAGVYVCSATNMYGNDTSSATLQVYAPSSFLLLPPAKVLVALGNSFSVACVTRGQPTPTLTWSRGGVPITIGPDFNTTAVSLDAISTLHILEVCDVGPSYFGAYACTATQGSPSSVITHQFDVTQILPADITIPPASQTVMENGRVELTCTVNGPPPPEVKFWGVDEFGEYHINTTDEVTLITTTVSESMGVTTLNLTMLDLHPSKQGTYICSGETELGNDTATAMLNVYANTSFLAIPPPHQDIAINGSFLFSCVARGQPLPTITWSKNGVPITAGMHVNITDHELASIFTMSILQVCGAQLQDFGDYACTASNSLTVDTQTVLSSSVTHEFTIYPHIPVNITVPPQNLSVTEGDTIVLTCTASGPPLPELEWSVEDGFGEYILETDNSSIFVNTTRLSHTVVSSTLTLSNVEFLSSGVYTCSVTNYLGSDTATAMVEVFDPSILLLIPPTELTIVAGSSLLLSCVARGQPVPEISWTINGMLIDSEHNISVHELYRLTSMSVLELCDVQIVHAGEYACTAANSITEDSQIVYSSSATHRFNVTVLGGPAISTHPGPDMEELLAGMSVSRNCVATGNPIPTITWRKDGVEITGNEPSFTVEEQTIDRVGASSTLRIGSLESQTAGVYQCFANGTTPDGNSLLVYSNTSEIIFTSPPNLLEEPLSVAIFINRRTVTFTCVFEGTPLPYSINWTLTVNGSMTPTSITLNQNIEIEMTTYDTNVTSVLTINAPTFTDVGIYTCTAFNGITTNLIRAELSGSAGLFIRADDPFLVVEPTNSVVVVGLSTRLECAGGSVTSLEVLWTKNGQPFQLSAPTTEHEQVYTRNIMFPMLEDADSGVYVCTVTSQQYGRSVTTRPATLTVFTPVSILEGPVNTTVNVSTTLTWSCLVQGSHDVRVSWMNGSSQVVPDGSRVEITTQPLNNTFRRTMLTIRGVAATDSALYSCNISNSVPMNSSFTSSDNRSFTLFVQSPPVILSLNGTRPAVVDGSPAETLHFRITEDIPLVRDDAVLTSFNRYDGAPSSPTTFSSLKNGSEVTLSISSVNISTHEGNYTVHASNPAGVYSKIVYLDVQSPPVMLRLEVSGEVQVRRMNYVAVERGRVVLICSFLADPRPTVTWQQNGVNINTNQARRYSVRRTFQRVGPIGNYTERLIILNAAERDEGNYTCLGENIHSNTARPVLDSQPLEVIVPPTVTPLERNPIGVETRDGRPSQIRVGFTITRADPEVVLDNITLTYSNRSHSNIDLLSLATTDSRFQLSADLLTLTISDLRFFDAGSITLTASNEAGTDTGTIQLDVHVEPNLLNETTHFNETLVEGETAVFSCFADGYPLPRIVWLHNGNFVATSSTTRRMVSLSNPTTSPERDYIQAQNSTLIVPRLRLREAGEYICRVDPANIDRGTSVLSDTLDLTVLPAPIDYCTPDPCVNGVCSNQSSTYLCTCVPVTMWRGINCTIEIFEFEEVEIVMDPDLREFPFLFSPITLTCGVEGIPEPNITWYKDRVQLEGERSRTLVISEVDIPDRALYRCTAENFNPNNQEQFEDISDEVVVNIKGIAQYTAELALSNSQESGQQMLLNSYISRLSGIPLGHNTTVFSVSNTTEMVPGVATPIQITLLASNGGSSELTERLTMRMNITAREVEGVNLAGPPIRFDGCEEETTILPALEPGGLEVIIEWPEADLGEVVTVQCPCGNLSALGGANFERTATRRCWGNFTHGAVWDDGMIAACNFSIATRQLCQIANVIDEPEMAISELDRITSQEEDIGVDEFSVTTILIEAVSTGVEQDRNLTEGLFEVVDNLLEVDPMSIQTSQAESNTTARILEVVEGVAQSVPIPENQTSTTIQLDSFAVGVMEIRDKEDFEGQIFSVDLGQDFSSKDKEDISLDNEAVSFANEAANLTASLEIDSDFFKDQSVLDAIAEAAPESGNSSENFVPRMINSVYLTDRLFPRISTNENKSDVTTAPVGSVILSSTLTLTFPSGNDNREVRVTNINPPITLTFQKTEVLNSSDGIEIDTTCYFWDFSANDGLGDWSDENCILVNNNSDSTAVCQCTHFTNFAILLDPNPVERPIPPAVDNFLSVLSYIGVIVSIICLIITVITYITSAKLRASEAGQLLLHLSFGLLGVYILFMLCLQATFNEYACAVAGGFLHYFLLVSFFLMAAEAINLFVKLVIVLGIPAIIKDRYVLKASLISWIVPLVIVIVSEAPDYTNYVSDVFCRPYGPAFYGGLVAPFGVIYLFNWALFLAIIISFLRKKKVKSGKKGESKSKLRQQFIIALTLSALFGLGWGFGFAATSSIPILSIATIIQAIFIILTSFQGLLIFIMQCLRSEDARNEWKRWIRVITCNKIKFKEKKKNRDTFSSSGARGTLSTSYSRSSVTSASSIQKDSTTYKSAAERFGARGAPTKPKMQTIDEAEKGTFELEERTKTNDKQSPDFEETYADTTYIDDETKDGELSPSPDDKKPVSIDDSPQSEIATSSPMDDTASTNKETFDANPNFQSPVSPSTEEDTELVITDLDADIAPDDPEIADSYDILEGKRNVESDEESDDSTDDDRVVLVNR